MPTGIMTSSHEIHVQCHSSTVMETGIVQNWHKLVDIFENQFEQDTQLQTI